MILAKQINALNIFKVKAIFIQIKFFIDEWFIKEGWRIRRDMFVILDENII